jgi:hypothetical protein
MPELSNGTRWLPIEEYSQTWWTWPEFDSMWECELNGEKAWTNGHMLCLGKPPCYAGKTISLDHIKHHFDREVYEIHPLAVADFGKASVVFDSGHLINVRYFDVIREKFPAVKWFGCDKAKGVQGSGTPPLLARDGGKLVGMVMCVRADEWESGMQEIFDKLKGNDAPKPLESSAE